MAPAGQEDRWLKIAPTRLIVDNDAPGLATSDALAIPLHQREVDPHLTVRSMIMMGVLGLAMVYAFMPKGRVRINNRMFFLGAAFMLLETKAVVQMALLFGSTWLVNSAVFLTCASADPRRQPLCSQSRSLRSVPITSRWWFSSPPRCSPLSIRS